MNLQRLIMTLEQQGIRLEPKLKFDSRTPLTAEQADLLKQHKLELLAYLTTQSNVIPRLPWQLERLLSAAASGVLHCELPGVPDASHYALAWGCAYLTGDKDDALRRLWQLHAAWKAQVN